MIIRESVQIGDKTVTLETGRIAKQAAGSVLLTCGETVLLVTVGGTQSARPGIDFMPLSVDYVEKTYAAGKVPGGFFKREARLRDHEILTSRLIDRPCRPLFPEGYRNEIQVIATVLSVDLVNPSDVLALTGASAALSLSPIPWAGPIAGVRVGRIEGKFVANPTYVEQKQSDCDLIIAASRDAIVMVEGEADQMSEEDMIEALFFGHAAVQDSITLIEKFREAAGKPKWHHEAPTLPDDITRRVREVALDGVRSACSVAEKLSRYARFGEVKKATVEALSGEFPDREKDIKNAFEALRYNEMRSQILREKRRVDGRDMRTVRDIAIEIGFLPRTHGSSLFTRGETQAIVTTTLGTSQDEQKLDLLTGEEWKRFLLHYNFPPFSVGEVKPLRGPGRREIGHGNLAERALKGLLPGPEDFPYTIRIVSEITESNGSSSMATVCGGSLAMMDAGVPIKAPVAGVAMGLIKEGDDYEILTDILGDEDHLGDMDFKVCGTDKGVTAIQMDIKIAGLSREILQKALAQAKDARLHVLSKMNEIIAQPREDISQHAPRITTIKIKPDQIRSVIGPGGKVIKGIVEQTGVAINVADDGTVSIASSDSAAVDKALEIVRGLTTEPEVGATYKGTVRRVEPYGAFLEIMPGTDGLCHISDMAWEHVERVEDVMNLGDEVQVMVTNIDGQGRVRLSRKELLEKPEGYVERPPRERSDRGDRDGGRGGRDRDRDRGGRGGRGGRDRDRGPSRGRDGDRDRGPSRGRDGDRDRGGDRERGPDRDRDADRPREDTQAASGADREPQRAEGGAEGQASGEGRRRRRRRRGPGDGENGGDGGGAPSDGPFEDG